MKFNFNVGRPLAMISHLFRICLVSILLPSVCNAQLSSPPPTIPPIQDNSFLIEEAYNQEYGVVQHISSFTRFWNSKDWNYSFTQEWPSPGDERHQLSYTLVRQHAGALPGSGSGIGDVLLNYRYQLIGSGDTRVAVTPRLTLICPTGDSSQARGSGGFGAQTDMAASVVLAPKWVTHWNAGATFVPHAKNVAGNAAFSAGYNLGQSFIWLVHPRVNLMLETVFGANLSVVGNDKTEWSRTIYMSPGVRWSYNFKNGLQIVPGIAVPIGVGPTYGEKALLLYLSFEHPFRKLNKK